MRIIEFGPERARDIGAFGSEGLRAIGLLRNDNLAVTVLRLASGGRIGAHPAVGDQLLVVVAGTGEVCGEDGVWQPIAAGQAVCWRSGEVHATRADDPLTAVVIEAPELFGGG